jgi:hypothetical protein
VTAVAGAEGGGLRIALDDDADLGIDVELAEGPARGLLFFAEGGTVRGGETEGLPNTLRFRVDDAVDPNGKSVD